ncbi:MAG: hypothetical protein A3J79_02110 [Elusimicrobia bacterium RIFOXYB2_FULL_62_6]|nr:MAG: hypothetical protein A3J79_02110 [Elusimicrobia bacterium RIFOXYB2_FULL_62_6]
MCDEKGYKKAVLVTSAVHMRRSAWCFEKAGFADLTPYPAGYKSSKAYRGHFIDYLPGTGESLRLAAHEYLGLLFYKVRY